MTRKRRGIQFLGIDIYRLFLNMVVLGVLGCLIWLGIKVFSQQIGGVIGSVIFIVGLFVFVLLCSLVHRNRWRRPSFKITVCGLLVIAIIFTFAGVQPLSGYKDMVITKVVDMWAEKEYTAVTPKNSETPIPEPLPPPEPIPIPKDEQPEKLPAPYPKAENDKSLREKDNSPPQNTQEVVMPSIRYIMSDLEARGVLDVSKIVCTVGLDFVSEVSVGEYRIILASQDGIYGEHLIKWHGDNSGVKEISWNLYPGMDAFYKLLKGVYIEDVVWVNVEYKPFVATTTFRGLEGELVGMINEARTSNGLVAVNTNDTLRTIAEEYAVNMAMHNSELDEREYISYPYVGLGRHIYEMGGVTAIDEEFKASLVTDTRLMVTDALQGIAVTIATIDSKNYYVAVVFAPDMSGTEFVVHRLINEERRAMGLSWISWDNDMYILAKNQSDKMAQAGDIFHSPRYALEGGENAWMSTGFYSDSELASVVVATWMQSKEGHREWLLHPDVKRAGVGISASNHGTFCAWSFSK